MASKDSKETKVTTEERVMTRYDRKVMKRNEEEMRRKKKKVAVRGTGIVILAACVIAIAFVIISTISKSLCYIKVDDKNISKAEFDFYYNKNVNTNSSMYTMYYGLDLSQPLEDQNYSDSLTWRDYFEQMATQELLQVKALVKESKENNFDGDIDKEFETYMQGLAQAAKDAGKSEDAYYKDLFGASKDRVKEYLKEYVLAGMWYEKLTEDNKPSDEEIETYYGENKDTYDYVTYYMTSVSAEGITVGQSSDDEVSAAMVTANAKAQETLQDIENQGELNERKLKSDISVTLTEWLFDEARTPGETTVVDDKNSAVCYALKFVERGRDESATKNIRLITSAETEGDKIIEEWEKTDKTEDSFIKLVEKYVEGTVDEGGLLESVTRSETESIEGLAEWLFEEERKTGDVKAFVNTDPTTGTTTNMVIYYKEEGDPAYKASISSTLASDKTEKYVQGITDAMKLADPKHVLKYLETADNTEAGE